MRGRGLLYLGISVSHLLTWGCTLTTLLDPSEVVDFISGAALRPERTCEELRAYYRVPYLPCVLTPAELGMDYEEHWVLVDERTVLRTWLLPTRLDRGTVILSNGNSGSLPAYLFAARLLARNGWSVVMYDYEGFGGSAGQPSMGTMYRDLEAVLEWTLAWTGRQSVTLMGVSLGSIPSIAIAVARPDVVNAVILDSPIAVAAQIERFEFVLGEQAEWMINQLERELLPDELIAELWQPLLVFEHGQDVITTPQMVETLFAQAPGPKELVRFPDLEHVRGQFFRTDVYLYHLERFLADVWSDQP